MHFQLPFPNKRPLFRGVRQERFHCITIVIIVHGVATTGASEGRSIVRVAFQTIYRLSLVRPPRVPAPAAAVGKYLFEIHFEMISGTVYVDIHVLRCTYVHLPTRVCCYNRYFTLCCVSMAFSAAAAGRMTR